LPSPSRLDEPLYAEIAWSRYWRLMRWMGVFSILLVIVTLGILYYLHGPVSIHLYIAAAGGVAASLMLTSALMGLVFLSSGTGHDESIEDPLSKEIFPDE